jgi:hypothetical protein
MIGFCSVAGVFHVELAGYKENKKHIKTYKNI